MDDNKASQAEILSQGVLMALRFARTVALFLLGIQSWSAEGQVR